MQRKDRAGGAGGSAEYESVQPEAVSRVKKIPTVFQRNYDTDRLVRDEVVPGADWVVAGEGIATRKWDGQCCAIQNGEFLKRYELKAGKVPPFSFRSTQEPGEVTGNTPGWVVVGYGPEDKWLRAAFELYVSGLSGTQNEEELKASLTSGTFEAVGPHFGGGHHEKNPEGVPDQLIPHGKHVIEDFPRTFEGMKSWFEKDPIIEGVVFWHPDGRKAKLKLKDFGIKRRPPTTQIPFYREDIVPRDDVVDPESAAEIIAAMDRGRESRARGEVESYMSPGARKALDDYLRKNK